jgi:hypothetical protein
LKQLAEEEIGIELERQRRAGKQGSGNGGKNKNHCKMCDCTYTVNWGTHKISLGHRVRNKRDSYTYCLLSILQNFLLDSEKLINYLTIFLLQILKEFLHPTCRHCDVQFVHRMDWLNHLFSLTHLRRLYELKAEGKDLKEQETPNQAELFSINIEMNSEEEPINFITIRNTEWKIPSKEGMFMIKIKMNS